MKNKTKLRIFILEAPDPMDLLQGRSEREALEKVCKLIGHEVFTFHVKSKSELKTISKYISSIDSEHDETNNANIPLCIHISAHGNKNGLGFGYDFIKWKELFKCLKPLFSELDDYEGNTILVISACRASNQELTDFFEDEFENDDDFIPPIYLFVTMGSPLWDDALVSWANFYHQLPKVNLDKKAEIQTILNRSNITESTRIRYYRWDEEEESYKQYTSKKR